MKHKWLLSLLMVGSSGLAGSRVIRDNRLDDLGVSPTLGRGYSIATNTYQSTCMSDIQTITPSYDLKYSFNEIEQNWEREFSNQFSLEAKFQYLFLKGNVSFETETSGNDTYHYHHIFAKIQVDSYYYSMDESSSNLSEAAITLLKNGDTVSFFDACGPYYIRNIGRHSNFYAMLRYRTTSSTRDSSFDIKTKATLRGFFSGSAESEISREYRTEAESKNLSISIWAHGLGKDQLANLIPTDLDSFKTAIREAIQTMQDPDAGRVTSIEVAPWVENVQFQQNLTLEEAEISDFLRRRNLEANSELIAEIDRIDRSQVDQYHKALNCRRVLEEQYLESEMYDPERTWFDNIVDPQNEEKQIALVDFDSSLSESVVENLYTTNSIFMEGNDNDYEGAVSCITQLEEQGLDAVHFRSIQTCNQARAFSVPVNPLLDQYCLPELGRVEEEGTKTIPYR